ncbi:MAG TPA: ribose-phosphate pyrophosphokinase [Chloroflexota bacterium]|nr:ribose-phosphate pyrophosphokinase [Chloroflexota bacterium]
MHLASTDRFALLAGSANPALAESVANRLGVAPMERDVGRFPDGELRVALGASVRGRDVYLVQPTAPPVDQNLVELLLLADACRRSGAARLTTMVPYFGYARQERRQGREPVSARLVADLVEASGVDRIVAVDLHAPAIEGFFRIPVEHLTAVPLLAERASTWLPPDSVVVAPDLGAVKVAERYARILGLPLAVLHKTRSGDGAVSVRALTGEVEARAPLVVDDMVSTGATVDAAVRAVLAAGARPEVVLAATHGLFVPPADALLSALPIQRVVVTDSVAVRHDLGLPLDVVGLAPLLTEAVRRLHRDRSVGELVAATASA